MTAAPQHPSGRRKRLPHHLGCLTALGIALTACAAPPAPGSNPYLGWMEASSPKNLEVERAQYRHTIHFATDSADLTAMEQERLLTFLQTVAPTAQDTCSSRAMPTSAPPTSTISSSPRGASPA